MDYVRSGCFNGLIYLVCCFFSDWVVWGNSLTYFFRGKGWRWEVTLTIIAW